MIDVKVIRQRLEALEEWREDVVARYATERELDVAIHWSKSYRILAAHRRIEQRGHP
jgi:hypothetical protein